MQHRLGFFAWVNKDTDSGMTDWTTKAYSKNSTPVEIDEKLLDEEVVILMQGRNVYGDQIYSYLQLTLRNLHRLKDAMDADEQFMPADYGTVLAAGKGEPTDELRAEMAVSHNLIDVPKERQSPSVAFTQPAIWDED